MFEFMAASVLDKNLYDHIFYSNLSTYYLVKMSLENTQFQFMHLKDGFFF